MMLPWTPLAIVGLVRGPNAELSGSVSQQGQRAMLWRFLLCWFTPGILFLSLAMKMKHHHYSMPLLPPLTIPAALGLDYYVRRQMTRRQGLVWPWFLGGCLTAIGIVRFLPQISSAMKPPIIALIAILAIGGLASLQYERARRPGMVIASYFMTAWLIGVGVQSWAMPVQDDFKFQADFARAVNAAVPPGDIVYMLGHREEEQEAQYAYYLRFPMQRLASADDFRAVVAGGATPAYAIAPAGFLAELNGIGQIQTVARCGGLRQKETDADRLCLLRVTAESDSSTNQRE
jgi:4-amino-4-deoxy-L-arabinose transferase-like glycosyltransferase